LQNDIFSFTDYTKKLKEQVLNNGNLFSDFHIKLYFPSETVYYLQLSPHGPDKRSNYKQRRVEKYAARLGNKVIPTHSEEPYSTVGALV
jgi:hypothetical protein